MMADDLQKPVSDTAAQVIAELNSGYSHGGGPKKEILGITLVTATSDPARNDITALVDVNAYQESPYGDSANTRRSFRLSLAVVQELSGTAPDFRGSFAGAAREMAAQLEKEREPFLREQAEALAARQAQERVDDIRRVENWCDQGLPTNAPTVVRRPLRLTRKNGFRVTHG
jgi:hypothetical protein